MAEKRGGGGSWQVGVWKLLIGKESGTLMAVRGGKKMVGGSVNGWEWGGGSCWVGRGSWDVCQWVSWGRIYYLTGFNNYINMEIHQKNFLHGS